MWGVLVGKPQETLIKESKNLTRRYTFEIIESKGYEKDTPSLYVFTNPQIMAWIMDTYSIDKDYTLPGVITRITYELVVSLGMEYPTSHGCN